MAQSSESRDLQIPTKNSPSLNNMTARMPSLLDREIRTQEADSFGHQHFANALESLIESDEHTPPYSIGLLGKWGTGKSSIKALYLHGLTEDRQKDERNLTRPQRIHPITFNAWRYGGENIRRALLRHVFKELGGNEEALIDRLFNQVQKPTLVPKPWEMLKQELYDRWPWMLVQLLFVAVMAIGGTYLIKRLFNLDDAWQTTVILTIQTLLGGALSAFFFDPKRFGLSRYATITRVELPSVTAEQFEKFLLDEVVEFRKRNPKCERLVIFVDDLDRLSAEEMVSGLDAIRTFMEMPFDKDGLAGLGIVFIISCDEDRVADALANRRKQNSSDLPGVIFNRTDARRYLDRIFQFRLEIPPFPRQDMRSYALDRLQTKLPEIAQGISKYGGNVEEVVSRMIHVGVQSPRNALQIVNAFAESWWIAEARERAGSGTDRRGALSEGSVTKYPLALAALSALRVDFPDFYGDLQQEPDLIARFIEVFVHKKEIAEQPEGVRIILERYTVPQKIGEETGGKIELQTQLRPLRQYLTSISTIPWPPSMQPLLLLSQDPISRKVGDAGRRIYEAFVSGDVDGVLADLGRDKDTRKLEADQVRWLRDLGDQIEEDTDDRKDNAGAVIAALADRLPEADAHHLLVPLARRLANSQRLRWRVGIDHIPPMLPFIPEADRRNVTARLISDLLKVSGEIDFKLPTGETPSLDEAMAMSRSGVMIAMSVRKECGLEQRSDQQLLDWILVRHVGVAGKTQQLPFSELEQWMDEHQDHLLPSLSTNYLTSLADMMEEGTTYQDIKLEGASRRIETVLSNRWETGEESREAVWSLVNRFVRVPPPEANLPAQRFFRLHQAQAPQAVVSIFINNAAARVQSYVTDKELDEADTDAINLLTAILPAAKGIKNEAYTEVADLCIKLSTHEHLAELATGLTASLLKTNAVEGQRVLAGWAVRSMSDLPPMCLDYLAMNYPSSLSEMGQTSFISQLNTVIQDSAPASSLAERYVQAINGIPGDAFQDEPLRSHIVSALSQVAQNYSNQEYLQAVLPTVPKIVKSGPPAEVGQMLHNLARQARNLPGIQGLLHERMAGNWPTASSELAPYAPESIFTWAKETVTQQPSHASAVPLLASMESMITDGVVPKGQEANLNEAAVSVWPYFPSQAGEVLVRSTALLPPNIIGNLSSTVPSDNADAVTQLQKVWHYYTGKFDFQQRVSVVTALLANSEQSFGGQPDGYLSLWFDQLGDQVTETVEELLHRDEINEDQKMRVWKQYEYRMDHFDREKQIYMLNLALETEDNIARSALDTSGRISERYQSHDDKFTLGKELMRLFSTARNLECKNRLAQWLRDLGNETVFSQIPNDISLDPEDVQILLGYFPKNKNLQKRLPKE